MRQINWIRQPDGHTCGPTSLKMALDYLGVGIEIDEITRIYNNKLKEIGGMPFFRMEKVLLDHNINYEIIIDKELKNLKQNLKDNLVLLSVLTVNNVKHWCLVYDADDTYFYVADPMIGKYRTRKEELIKLTLKRNFLYIMINESNPIKIHQKKDNELIFTIVDRYGMKLNIDSNILFGKTPDRDYFFKLDNKRNGDDYELLASNPDRKRFLKVKMV
jgi:ABC-type bacteriocin/lantibiotic exporter with double-glycine peptidase domain